MGEKLEILITADDAASGVLNGIHGALGSIGDIAGGALTFGLGAATAAIGALGVGLGISLNEAMNAEKVQAALAATLKSTGGAAGLTQQAANDLAMQFRDLAGGSDDAILAIETIGLRAGTISAQEMPQFIQATLDLGAVMGSTEGAAQLLALAHDDASAAAAKAKRAGVILTAEKLAEIKALQDAGKSAEATAVFMDALSVATGGQAAAAANTFSGQLDIMKNHLLEGAETIGMALLPVARELFEQVIAPAIPFVEDLAKAFGAFIEVLMEGDIAGALDTLGEFESFQMLLDLLGIGGQQFYAFNGAVEAAVGQIMGFFQSVSNGTSQFQPLIDAVGGLLAAVAADFPQMQAAGQTLVTWLQTQFANVGPQVLGNLTTAINALTLLWQQHGDTVIAVLTVAFQIIGATIGGAITLISGIVSAGLQLLSGDWQGALQTMGDTLTSFMNLALSIVGTDLGQFVATWQSNWGMLQIIVSQVLMNITSGFQTWTITTINNAVAFAKNIISTLTGYYDTFQTIGIQWFEGIRLGILLKVGQLISTIVQSIKDALDAARTTLGIASPSEVFAEIGRQTMAGFAQGIHESANMPAFAVENVASQVTESARERRGGGDDRRHGADFHFHYSPGVSLGSREEAQEQIAPYVREAVRELG